jgi:hypothetical protein
MVINNEIEPTWCRPKDGSIKCSHLKGADHVQTTTHNAVGNFP